MSDEWRRPTAGEVGRVVTVVSGSTNFEKLRSLELFLFFVALPWWVLWGGEPGKCT